MDDFILDMLWLFWEMHVTMVRYLEMQVTSGFFWLVSYFEMQIIVTLYFGIVMFF
jgi:hypothetical protein